MDLPPPRVRDRLVPFGILSPAKPRHYREMLKVAWENKGEAAFAWRILSHGVCDGCSLGPRGLKDDVIDGTHLCLTRLKLLRFNTMGAMREPDWSDVARLRAMSNTDLQELGRVPYPLLIERGDAGFRRIPWDDALRRVARAVSSTPPERQGYFVTSRGLYNEAYYAIQKLARVAGRTNNVDLCSRLCHAPSTTGLKETIGWGAPTVSLKDLIGADLVVLFGTDLANNQPVSMKYLLEAKRKGTRVVVVNPFREPSLERYWVPSDVGSALFGTAIMDEFVRVNVGGDVAFMTGVLKVIIDRGWEDRWFVEARTTGFEAMRDHVAAQEWDAIVTRSGVPRDEIERFAATYARVDTAVLVYSMGLTQHAFGVDNVRMIANLALVRGNVGRPRTGILPIRGHSGVQGGGECGAEYNKYPGGYPVGEENARRFSSLWGEEVPWTPGLDAGAMVEAAAAGRLDLLYNLGGNLLHTMPDPRTVKRALERVRLRVHQDIVLNESTVLDGEAVLVLPAATRYETPGGVTATSTERRIRYSPEIPGRRIGEAKPEWEIPTLIGRAAGHEKAFAWAATGDVRREIAAAMPMYAGIERLEREGDSVQWGGERLGETGFPNMPDGRARFSVVAMPFLRVPPGTFQLSTRRGKQFNSITYRGAADPVTGGKRRDEVLMNADDARRLGASDGDRVRVWNDLGEMVGRVRTVPIAPRHVQAYWPEANVLIGLTFDPEARIPDYNAVVRIDLLMD